MEITAPRLTKAEENCATIAKLVEKIHYNFLELGGLLLENQENGYWGAQAESFKDFIQQLGVSYDWATRMMDVVRGIAENLFTKEEVLEIGVAKICLLLPHIKKGKLDGDIKLLARDCTFNDLRKRLGHNLVDPEDCGEYLKCPRCGQDITILPGMIKRR